MHTKGNYRYYPNSQTIEIDGGVVIADIMTDKDDAEYICKCVNNHERMKEALRICIIDAGIKLTKKERIDRISYAEKLLKDIE